MSAMFVAAALLSGAPAQAQINVEPLVNKLDEGLGLDTRAGVDVNRGNTEILTLKGSATLHAMTFHERPPEDPNPPLLRHRLLLSARATRKSANGELAQNDGFGHLRATTMWHPRLGAEAFTQLQFDEFRLLKRRTLLGSGLRVVAVNRAAVQLWFGTGYMAEWEERNVEPPDEVHVLNHRSTSYATIRWNLAERVSLLSTGYIQPRIDAPRDIQLLSESAFSVRLSENLALSIDLTVRHDSRPPDTIKATDIITGNSLIFTM